MTEEISDDMVVADSASSGLAAWVAPGINATAQDPITSHFFGASLGAASAMPRTNVAWQGITSSATYTSAKKALSQA